MRYRQDPDTRKFIEYSEWVAKYGEPDRVVGTHHNIIEDIKPFRSPVDGQMITSRRDLRYHNKLHDVVQVGNDKPVPKEIPATPGIKEDLIRVCKEKGVLNK